MNSTRISGRVALAGFVVGTLLSLPIASFAAPRAGGAMAAMQNQGSDQGSDRGSLDSAITAKLNKKQFENVKATVDNSVASLTGTVDLYEYKADAGKRVQKVKGISAVRNQIAVGGPTVPDAQLESKLVGKLQYDRVGYGNAFN